MAEGAATNPSARELAILRELEKKVLWLASWTIHHANHQRENVDGVKVGGHQASSASLATIMTALYFDVLRPQDRVAVKPHASPIYHAIQYLLGRQSRQKLEDFRGYKGAQSYPSRSKDADDVDFSTGSVGLGVAQTLFSSLVQDYVRAHGWGAQRPEGRMIALVGDAELDEGNIFEAILEGWKQGLRNCWWIIDYNRQSLDAVIREGLWARFEALFQAFGWDVVILKYGTLLQQAFREPGGERLRQWIDNCPNQLYSALVFQGGAAWRRRLLDEIGDQGDVTRLIEARSDEELARLMTNLAGLMTPAQAESLRAAMNIRPGHEWDKFEGLEIARTELEQFLDRVPFAAGSRRHDAARIEVPADLPVTIQSVMSTQTGFGALLNELGRGKNAIAERIVTASPDVTVSTNLGPWVNRRGLFARESLADTFKSERIPSTFAWDFSPKGQHITLAPEGGAHQSIATPLIGIAQDGLAAFEPAFVDELAVILAFAFDYIQRDAEAEASERNWLRDETGGAVYLRLSTRPIEQIKRTMTPELRQAIVDGAYWQRPPGPNCQVVVAYAGAVVPEAIQAVGLMAEDRRDVGLLAVTSADRLNAGWTAAQRARERGLAHARSHIEQMLDEVPAHAGIVTVLDGHPATLAWLGAVAGHRVRSLGVEHFGQTGAIPDLYRHYGIDTQAIIAAAQALTPGRPIRHLRALG